MREGVSELVPEISRSQITPDNIPEYLKFFARQAILATTAEELTTHIDNQQQLIGYYDHLKDQTVSEAHNPSSSDVYRFYMHLGAQNRLPEAFEDLINAYEWLYLDSAEATYDTRRSHFLGGTLLMEAAFLNDDPSTKRKLLINSRKHFYDVKRIYETTPKLSNEKGEVIYNPKRKWDYAYYRMAVGHIYDIDMYKLHMLADQSRENPEQNEAISNYFMHKQIEFNERFQEFCREGGKNQAGFIFEWMFLLGQRDKIFKSGLLGSIYVRSAFAREDFPGTDSTELSPDLPSVKYKQGFDASVQYFDNNNFEQSRLQIQLKCRHKAPSRRKYKRAMRHSKGEVPVDLHLTQFNLTRDVKTERIYENGIEVYRISTNIKEMQTRARQIISDYQLNGQGADGIERNGDVTDLENKLEKLNQATRAQFDQFVRI